MGKAEWGDNAVCWWLGLYFCFVCCLDEASCTECYWLLGDARSCIQVVSFVGVLTIWYSLGLVLWFSMVLGQCSHSKVSGLDLSPKTSLGPIYQEEFHLKWKGLYLSSKSRCTRTQWRSLTQQKLLPCPQPEPWAIRSKEKCWERRVLEELGNSMICFLTC